MEWWKYALIECGVPCVTTRMNGHKRILKLCAPNLVYLHPVSKLDNIRYADICVHSTLLSYADICVHSTLLSSYADICVYILYYTCVFTSIVMMIV